ncbi:hypothetical protein [Dyella sp. OK004]|uniref:hypothetical protein n=1 Tax=Dyella sp. OK004 TaxID=1855292 RepID=UPI00116082DB|nr:hypothetical protein [Dyella sp. OK004]
MNRQRVNRISGIVPVVLSLVALSLVIASVSLGWDRGQTDEGAAAHTFQLLVVAQIPFVLLFLITANWRRLPQTTRSIAFQAGALGLALGSVAYFNL